MSSPQTVFTNAIFQADLPVPSGLTDGHSAPAGKRFSVYRNNVAVNLTEALVTAFPMIERLVGPEFFRAMAGVFLRQHPPTSPLMMFYGAEMPTFLASFPPVSHLPYLPDVARVELALRHAYHAADAQPIDGATLQSLSPEGLVAVRFSLAPSVHILRSSYPIYDIFTAHHGGPKPGTGAQDLVVSRPALDPEVDLLRPGAATALTAFQTNKTLGEANDAATHEAPGFDLGATLGLALARGFFTHLTTE